MDELGRFYRRNLTRLLVLAGVAFFFTKTITPWVVEALSPYVSRIITSANLENTIRDSFNVLVSIAFTGLLLLGERFIRTSLWKYRFFHPDLDVSGEWKGITKYAARLDVPKENYQYFTSEHTIKIKQDCTTISISPTPGKAWVFWNSLAIALTTENGGTLKFAYYVPYDSNDPRFPKEAKGYEEMKVIQVAPNQRPIAMSGTFTHCWEGQSPVYHGETVFIRRNHEKFITTSHIPEFAQHLVTGVTKT
jgi:hypothetical protein